MAVTSQGSVPENSADRFPLLKERTESHESNDHVIDMERVGEPSSSSLHSSSPQGSDGPHHENGQSNGAYVTENSPPSSSSNGSNLRSSSLSRRSEGFGRRWSPFNTFLWISIELVFTISQIIAAVVVLYLSRHENPQTPLFAWVVGYAAGCTLSLPFYYWRYLHSNWIIDQRTAQLRQSSPRGTPVPEPNSYITISLTRSSDEEDGRGASSGAWNGQNMQPAHARIGALVEHFKMALDCFFAVWFVVGNVWIFGGHSSSSDAPNLYRLCIVFLTFSCIGYAMPFILCAMICCCLPCIISMLGVREDMNGVRGATEESINSLPIHKFKVRKDQSDSSDRYSPGVEEGGFIAAGTEKERAISGEDAVCCICLTRYEDDDELRELPCSHFFHTECVDKWLKINATCPLCKSDIGGSGSTSGENSSAVVESGEQVQGVRIASNQSNELRE